MKAAILLLFLAVGTLIFSQTALLSTKKCLVGDEIWWQLSVPLNSKESKVSYQEIKRFVPAQRTDPKNSKASKEVELELLEPFTFTISQENGLYLWKGDYKLIAWDTGFLELPAQVIDVDGKQFEIATPKIEVYNIALSKDREIYDIDEQFSALSRAEENESIWSRYKIWILSLLVFIVLILLWLLKRKYGKKPKANTTEISKTLLQTTLQKLDEIEVKQLWRSDIKSYFTEVSDVFRSFNSSLFQLDFDTFTSQQAMAILQQLKTPKHCLEPAQRILEHSDMVKFAQSAPNEIVIHQQIQAVKTVVTQYFEQKTR